MKTTLLTAATAALGMIGGCASNNAEHSYSNQNPNVGQNQAVNGQQANASFGNQGNLNPHRSNNLTPFNENNQFSFSQPEPFSQEQALFAGSAVTLANAAENDSSFIGFLENAYGVAIFPVVSGEDAQGFNRGIVLEQGRFVGESSTNPQNSADAPAFSQIVFFEDADSFNAFRNNGFALRNGTPTFPIVQGASQWARYTQGVAVFTTAGQSNDDFAPAGGQNFTFFDINE